MFGGILIIENNFSILSKLTSLLEKEGHDFCIAHNTRTGVELSEKIKPSVIICSAELPDFQVSDFRHFLSQKRNGMEIPVFLLSTQSFGKPPEKDSDTPPEIRIFSYDQIEDLITFISKILKKRSELTINPDESALAEPVGLDSGILYENSRIMLKVSNAIKIFRLNDIEHITAFRDYSSVFTRTEGALLIKKTLKSWESILPKNLFLRIHRSAILNMDYVDSISRSKWHARSYSFTTKISKKEFLSSQRYSSRIKAFLFK